MATGDIVPMMVGKLYREFCTWKTYRSHFVMDCTIHDSVRFDCKTRGTAKSVARKAKEVMESAPYYLKKIFDIDFNLPLEVEVKMGPNWKEMKELTLA